MARLTAIRALGGLGLLSLIGLTIVALQVDPVGPDWAVGFAGSTAAIAAWLWVDRVAIDRILRARGLRHFSATLAVTGAVVSGAIGLNIAAHETDVRWDLTSTQRHAVSPATVAVLEALEFPVHVHGFFSSGTTEAEAFENLLASYRQHTDRITVAMHDPIRDPTIAAKFQVDNSLGTVILTMDERTQRIEADAGEEDLTNALIRLVSSVDHTICATEGHGEIDPDDDLNPASFSSAITKLEQQNYTVRPVNLARTGAVPGDCSLLLIGDPRTNFTPAELTSLDAHVTNGGQMLVLLDPGHAPNLVTALANYGIDVGENLVLETHPQYQLMGGDESYLVVTEAQMTDHPIMEPITGMVLLRVARTVQALQPPMDDFDVGELFVTSPHAYAETNLDGSALPNRDDEDPAGQLGLAVASVHRSGGRVVVFGDSDFASNELLDQASNYDLLPNSIAWLVGEPSQVSIRQVARGGGFTMSAYQGIVLWVAGILAVPGLALVGAGVTWMRRRNR